jgi:hypothetical protein
MMRRGLGNWLRRHPLGFPAIFFGLVFPLLMWAMTSIAGLSEFPHPVRPLDFIAYWLILGAFSGSVYYGLQRVMIKVISRAARR